MSIGMKECKDALVKKAEEIWEEFSQEGWEPPLTDEEKVEVTDVRNWNLRYEAKDKDLFKKVFDCFPFDDQMRGYTWDDGEKIVYVEVQGE